MEGSLDGTTTAPPLAKRVFYCNLKFLYVKQKLKQNEHSLHLLSVVARLTPQPITQKKQMRGGVLWGGIWLFLMPIYLILPVFRLFSIARYKFYATNEFLSRFYVDMLIYTYILACAVFELLALKVSIDFNGETLQWGRIFRISRFLYGNIWILWHHWIPLVILS